MRIKHDSVSVLREPGLLSNREALERDKREPTTYKGLRGVDNDPYILIGWHSGEMHSNSLC